MTGEDVDQPVIPQPKGAKEPETVTLTKAEHAALVRERDESRESERFWANRARSGKEPEAEQEEPIETDGLIPVATGNEELDRAIFDDPEKWTEALTKGPKAVKDFIGTLGLITAKEAAEIAVKAARQEVKSTVRGMQTDSELVGEYKEMKDPKSELFKTAAPIYQKLVRMNGDKQSTALLFAAAGQARAILDAKAPKPKPRDDDYDRYEPEEDRRDRARAQGSDRGRPAPVADDEADGLGPEALAICKAMGVSADEYAASQKILGTRRHR